MSDHVLAEIARLSGAIAQHRSGESSQQSTTAAASRRGRGRGSYTAVARHRNAKWVAPGRPGASSQDNSRSNSPAVAETARNSTTIPAPGPYGYRNKTLVLGGGSGSSTPVATPKPSSNTPTAPSTPQAGPTASSSAVAPASKEVVIDGVAFVADSRGNKLVRKLGPPSVEALTGADEQASTPKRASVSGTTYIRTKSGNLVSLDFARRRKDLNDKKAMLAKKERLDRLVGIVKDTQSARDGNSSNRGAGRGRGRGRGKGRGAYAQAPRRTSSKLCRFFQKTGQCTRGLTCPYVHSSLKVSICPLFLRHKCPSKASACLLSHSPNANRSPHCHHFPNCKNGESCPYAHVIVDKAAAVCPAFVEYGWCERGAECTMRHAIECPEFSERGTCSKAGCKLPHILRRRNEDGVVEEEDDTDEEGDEDDEDALAEGEIDWYATKPSKRRLGDDEDDASLGISGAAGRRLTKKNKSHRMSELEANDDFVTLSIPLDDGDSDDESDGDSVDSADLDHETASEAGHVSQTESVAADAANLDPSSAAQSTGSGRGYADDESDSDDDQEVEQLLRY